MLHLAIHFASPGCHDDAHRCGLRERIVRGRLRVLLGRSFQTTRIITFVWSHSCIVSNQAVLHLSPPNRALLAGGHNGALLLWLFGKPPQRLDRHIKNGQHSFRSMSSMNWTWHRLVLALFRLISAPVGVPLVASIATQYHILAFLLLPSRVLGTTEHLRFNTHTGAQQLAIPQLSRRRVLLNDDKTLPCHYTSLRPGPAEASRPPTRPVRDLPQAAAI